MNKFLIYIMALVLVSCNSTKTTTNTNETSNTTVLDRSQPPKAGPAPEIKIGEYQTFELENGLKVYVVENNKLPRVAFSLKVDRDPILEADKTGYLGLVGNLLTRGTTSKSKAEIDESVDFIGATLNAGSTGMFGASLTKHKDDLLSIMQDVLLNASFPQEELDKLKKIELSNLVSSKDDPGAIINNIRGVVVYGKEHPYGEMVSEQTLENITREDVKEYFDTYWSPKKAYLAIVGDVSLKEAKELANQYFGNWKGEAIPTHTFDTPTPPSKTQVVLVDRPQSVQSEIRVSYPVKLNVGDEDFFAATLLNQILGGSFSSRLMQNLREDKAFTYSAGSGFAKDKVIGRWSAGGSFRNEVTDSAVHEILKEMTLIVDEGITEKELKASKAYLTGSFARSLENPETIAGFALNTVLNDLPENYYPEYLKKLNAVTVEEVNAAAKKYILPENANIIVVGKAADVATKLKKFGEVIYYDVEGNVYDPSEMNKSLEGVNPKSIVNRYIQEIGGKEKLAGVSNQALTWTLDLGPQKFDITDVKTADGKFRTDITMQGMVVQQVIGDGENIVTIAQGQQQATPDEAKAAEFINNRLFPELYYEKSGVQLKLSGVEKIEGSEAYQVTLVYPSGEESQVYFDIESGLKVKDVATIDSPMGKLSKTTTYSNYKEVNGIKYAHSETTKAGPQSFSSELNKVEINTKIEDGYFTIK